MKENCGHRLKEFALEDLSAILERRRRGTGGGCPRSPSAALLSHSLSISSCGGVPRRPGSCGGPVRCLSEFLRRVRQP